MIGSVLRRGKSGGLVPLVAAALLTTGCAFHPRGTCGPACPAIEAATTIEAPTDRLNVLKKVAARENLSTHEQIYLVNAVCSWGFGDDQADALVLLIKNPCCTAETRKHIADMLHWVHLGVAKKRVVDALDTSTGEPGKPASAKGPPAGGRVRTQTTDTDAGDVDRW